MLVVIVKNTLGLRQPVFKRVTLGWERNGQPEERTKGEPVTLIEGTISWTCVEASTEDENVFRINKKTEAQNLK